MGEPPPKPESEPDDGEMIHYAAIGSAASEWAWLEQWIDFKTLELGKIPVGTGLCLTAPIAGAGRKLDAYIALARHLGAQKSLKQLNEFAKTLTSLGERRNRIVHDPWIVNRKERAAGRLEATARKSLRFIIVPVTAAEIAKLSVEIEHHIGVFDAIHAAVVAEVRT